MLNPDDLLDHERINELEDRKILEEFHCVREHDGAPSQCAHLADDLPYAVCQSHGVDLPIALMSTCPLQYVAAIMGRAMRKAAEAEEKQR